MNSQSQEIERQVQIPTRSGPVYGDLRVPVGAEGLVLFAHGSGSGRNSPRNRFVACRLGEAGLGTLLMDLLTAGEDKQDQADRRFRFDIPLLAGRLSTATELVMSAPDTCKLAIGYFGASTGAAAAIAADADSPGRIRAIVSRGGRPDLAGAALERLSAPILLLVGGLDTTVLELNRSAMGLMRCEKKLRIIPNAGHLFEQPGALEQVADLSAEWFLRHLAPGYSGHA